MAAESGGDEGVPVGLARRGRRRFRFLRISFVFLVLFFWALLLARNWGELSAMEWQLDGPWALVVALTFALYFLGLGAGWALISRTMGYPLPVRDGAAIWLLSMPARYVPGNLWHIATRIRLAQRFKVRAEGVLASSALEQALTVLSAACLGAAWLPSWMGTGGTVGAVAFLAACLVGLQPPVLGAVFRCASRLLGKPIAPVALGYLHLSRLLAWYGLVNAVNGLAFTLLAMVVARLPGALAPGLAGAYCLAYVIGYVSFLAPSGMGVREAALASMLVIYMPLPLAIAVSLLARLLSTAGEAIAVLLVGMPQAVRSRRAT